MKSITKVLVGLAFSGTLLAQNPIPVPMPMPINPVPMPIVPMPEEKLDCRGTGEELSKSECDSVFAYSAGASAKGTVLGNHWNNLSVNYQNSGFEFVAAENTLTALEAESDKEEQTAFIDGLGDISSERPMEFKLVETYCKVEQQEFGVVTQEVTMIVVGTITVVDQGYYSLVLTGFEKKDGKRKFTPTEAH
jgi:hypothetical protein